MSLSGSTEARKGAVCETSPSLALVKYWGKKKRGRNLPATPSIAVGLAGLTTTTRVVLAEDSDQVYVDGLLQPASRYGEFFAAARRLTCTRAFFHAESKNDFPSAAGLASSSSGFAALALACCAAAGAEFPLDKLSALARIGSASAARAVYGGFTLLPAGASSAASLCPPDHWPSLRILVAVVTSAQKELSSRTAMELTRRTSPYYRSWVASARTELQTAKEAIAARDLEKLGECVRRSYLRMFATMLGCDPPIVYMLPRSIALLRECERMRAHGIGVWETMDAGPQVKMLCSADDLPAVRARVQELEPDMRLIESAPGGAPRLSVEKV